MTPEPMTVDAARSAYEDALERNRDALAAGHNLPVGQGALAVLEKRIKAAEASA